VTKRAKTSFNRLMLEPGLAGVTGRDGKMHILVRNTAYHGCNVCSLHSWCHSSWSCGTQYYEAADRQSARGERDRERKDVC
jgi:hypothetical protein